MLPWNSILGNAQRRAEHPALFPNFALIQRPVRRRAAHDHRALRKTVVLLHLVGNAVVDHDGKRCAVQEKIFPFFGFCPLLCADAAACFKIEFMRIVNELWAGKYQPRGKPRERHIGDIVAADDVRPLPAQNAGKSKPRADDPQLRKRAETADLDARIVIVQLVAGKLVRYGEVRLRIVYGHLIPRFIGGVKLMLIAAGARKRHTKHKLHILWHRLFPPVYLIPRPAKR